MSTLGGMQTDLAGDLTSGRAFDNGCICHSSSEAIVNDLTGRETICQCGVCLLLIKIDHSGSVFNGLFHEIEHLENRWNTFKFTSIVNCTLLYMCGAERFPDELHVTFCMISGT